MFSPFMRTVHVQLLVHEWTSVATYSFQKSIQVHILNWVDFIFPVYHHQNLKRKLTVYYILEMAEGNHPSGFTLALNWICNNSFLILFFTVSIPFMCFFYIWDVVSLVHLTGCVTGFKLELLFFSTSLIFLVLFYQLSFFRLLFISLQNLWWWLYLLPTKF